MQRPTPHAIRLFRAIAGMFAEFVDGCSVISRMRLRITVVGVGLTALAKATGS
jgi:hypothetical protein